MTVVQQRNLQQKIDINWKETEELALTLITTPTKEYHLK
jgi:hypothetical protein